MTKCKITPDCTFECVSKFDLLKHIKECHPKAQNVRSINGEAKEYATQSCKLTRTCNFKTDMDDRMMVHILTNHRGIKFKKEGLKWVIG